MATRAGRPLETSQQPIRTAGQDRRRGVLRSLGLGLITGAADDDPSAIGTYASAGASFGPSFLWTAPVTLPMMVAVVYLSSKLGQVAGKGLFAVIREHYPRGILYFALIGVLIGNTIEAGADIGGMAAALNLFLPIPVVWIVVVTTLAILALQIWGSYPLIRNVFRWLSLALLAYAGSAILAKPELLPVIKGTLIPKIHFDREFLSMLVAVIGTTLSAYLYTWQSNEEVEEEIAMGRKRLSERKGATEAELAHSRRDIVFGMFFSNAVMYFIILSTAATLFKAGKTDITSAAQAAQALRPLAGNAAGVLFAIGVIGVGFLAVPVMTTGAAYDLCQTFGWNHGLYRKPREAKKFYAAIATFTLMAMVLNFFGFNPMKALVWAGIVQGFSTPPLMLLIMLMTNKRSIMGQRVNGRAINVLGWITTALIFAASIGLIWSWIA
ncbi:MAG: natural resistance-associated macrophage protein [Bryobacterales bacterium]|nr:natural resistance-associated macrophage protein [Bryobacterales bacterium]